MTHCVVTLHKGVSKFRGRVSWVAGWLAGWVAGRLGGWALSDILRSRILLSPYSIVQEDGRATR